MSDNISTVVEVEISRLTQFPTRVGFGVPLILDQNIVQAVGAVDTFKEVSEMVSAGFALTDEAVLAASALVRQTPRPVEFRVARREVNIAQINTITIDVVANATNYLVTLAGTLFTYLSDADATDLEIRDGLIALIDVDPRFNAVLAAANTFTVTAAVAGDGFSTVVSAELSFAVSTPNLGIADGINSANETENDWYFLLSTSRTEQDILAAASFIETQIKTYFLETDQADSKDLPDNTDTTSIFAKLKSFKYDRTAYMWIKTADLPTYPAASWVGKLGPKDPGTVNWKFKSLSGVPAQRLNSTEIKNVEDKNGNNYITIGGIDMTQQGKVASGEYVDIIRGTDASSRRVQENVFGLLTTEDKVGLDDTGIEQVGTQVEEALNEFVPDVFQAGTIVIILPSEDDLSDADKAERVMDGLEYEAKFTGAANKVKIKGRLTL